MRRKRNSAQHLIEYAVLLALVVAGLLAMRIFFTRGIQDKFRQAGDTFGQGEQYAKGITNTNYVIEPGFDPTEPGGAGGIVDCAVIIEEAKQLKEDKEDLLAQASEYESQTASMESQAAQLRSLGQSAAADRLTSVAATYRSKATACRDKAQQKQDKIDKLKEDYPDCFEE